MKRNYGMFVLAAAFVGALSGCSTKDEAPPPQLAPTPEMAQESQTAPALKVEDLERSTLDAEAPFVLKLETPASYTGQVGEIEVTARVAVPHTIDAPTSIDITVPKGATLVEGSKREQLANLPGGVLTRTFKLNVTKALTPSTPVKVAVHMKHPGGAFGAHAERQFPEKIVQTPVSRKNVPAPPVGRPGGSGGMKAPAGQRAMPGR